MSVNKVILMGNLGKDVELKNTASGVSFTNMVVATTESWNDKKTGEKQEKTEWHNVVVWGKLAEICAKYVAKGSKVFVEGSLHTRAWEDKDGNKRYTTEVNASNVQFVGSKNTGAGVNNNNTSTKNESSSEITADELPF